MSWIKKYGWLCIIVVSACGLTFMSEWISRGNLVIALNWCIMHIPLYLLTSFFLTTILLVLFFLTKLLLVAVGVTSGIVFLLSIINAFRLRFNFIPFSWRDFMLLKELGGISEHVQYEPTLSMIVGAIGLVVWCIIIAVLLRKKLLQTPKLVVGKRLKYAGISILVLIVTIVVMMNSALTQYIGFIDNKYSLSMLYADNGFLNSFVFTLRDIGSDNNSPLQEGEMAKAVISEQDKYFSENKTVINPPTIIMILSESQKDISSLSGVQFSQELMPFTNDLRKLNEAYVGTMISHTYGGGTANIEFDALTGFSSQQYPEGIIAYNSEIEHSIFSLPQTLKEFDYSTTAIHPFERNFYRRDEVYPYLGIDTFISLEDFETPTLIGPYVSDDSFVNEIIKRYQTQRDMNNQPQFILGISMENHGSYVNEKFNEKNPVRLTEQGPLSDDEAAALEIYAQGLYDSDQALKKLTEYFEQINEPVIIVQFGDHSPALGDAMDALGHRLNDDSLNELLFNYTTPIVYWSNYRDIELDQYKYISSDNIAPLLMTQTNIPLPPYYQFKLEYMEKANMQLQGYYVNQNGESITLNGLAQEYVETNEYLQNYFLTKDTTFLKTNEQIILTPTRENE